MHKLLKLCINTIINLLTIIQILWLILAFVTISFWIHKLAGLNSFEWANTFFGFIEQTTKNFYNHAQSPLKVDLTFFVSAVIMVVLSILTKYVNDFFKIVNTNYDSLHMTLKINNQKNFNQNLEKQVIKQQQTANKMLMLLDLKLEEVIKSNVFIDVKKIDLDEKKFELRRDFTSNLAQHVNFNLPKNKNDITLVFNNFDNVDKIIQNTYRLFQKIYKEAKKDNLKVTFFASVDSFSSLEEKESIIKKLKELKAIQIPNQIICVDSFKHRYEFQQNPEYVLDCQGTFVLGNENIEVYALARPNKNSVNP